jgi:hypothetical protein
MCVNLTDKQLMLMRLVQIAIQILEVGQLNRTETYSMSWLASAMNLDSKPSRAQLSYASGLATS